MENTIWDVLLRPQTSQLPCVAALLAGCDDNDGDRVRFGGSGSSPSVLLSRCGADHLSADVFLPDGGPGLTAEQERALDALGWHRVAYTSPDKGAWELGWRWYADAEVREKNGRAMVAALRDVLGPAAERLVVRAWGDDGPISAGFGLDVFSDRPSVRGAAGPCTGWEDLKDRLDWVLTTLPSDACVGLELRDAAGERTGSVQVMKTRASTAHTHVYDPALDAAHLPDREYPGSERARALFESGWAPYCPVPEVAGWEQNEVFVHTGAGRLPEQAIAAIRALGAEHPAEIRVNAFRNGTGSDPDYVAQELGLRPA